MSRRVQTPSCPEDLEHSTRASEVGPRQARNRRHGQGRWAGLEDRAGKIGPWNQGKRLGPSFRIAFEEGHGPGQGLADFWNRLPSGPEKGGGSAHHDERVPETARCQT